MEKQETIIVNLAHMPKDFGTARLRDSYLVFDNLNDTLERPKGKDTFPVKCETFMSVTIIKGSVTLIANMRELTLHAGQNLTMMPGCVFQGIASSADFTFFALVLSTEALEQIRNNIVKYNEEKHHLRIMNVYDLKPELFSSDIEMYKIIREELQQPDYSYKEHVVQRLFEIWVLKTLSMVENKDVAIQQEKGRRTQLSRLFMEALEDNFRQEHTVKFFADKLCVTPKYLSDVVKEVSGKNCSEWIEIYLTMEAKALLRSDNCNAKQVGMKLNFVSQSAFGRFFKKNTGYSPKEYQMLK